VWLLTPVRSAVFRRRTIMLVSAVYAALFAFLLVQALNGRPVVP
jgi:hypothetical protein